MAIIDETIDEGAIGIEYVRFPFRFPNEQFPKPFHFFESEKKAIKKIGRRCMTL